MVTDYLISYANGTGGHFLMSIIGHTVLHDVPSHRAWITKQLNKPLQSQGKFNDAHISGQFRNFGQLEVRNADLDNYVELEFNNIYRLTPGQPVFLPTHYYWPEKQFKKWPNARIVTILHTEQDLLDIAINSFYKTELNDDWLEVNQREPNYVSYRKWFGTNNVVFDRIRNKEASELEAEDLSLAVRTRIGMVISAGYQFIKPLDDPRMFYIQYRDLVSSPDSVVDVIKRATGREPPEHVITEIQGYQSRQDAFISKTKRELNL